MFPERITRCKITVLIQCDRWRLCAPYRRIVDVDNPDDEGVGGCGVTVYVGAFYLEGNISGPVLRKIDYIEAGTVDADCNVKLVRTIFEGVAGRLYVRIDISEVLREIQDAAYRRVLVNIDVLYLFNQFRNRRIRPVHRPIEEYRTFHRFCLDIRPQAYGTKRSGIDGPQVSFLSPNVRKARDRVSRAVVQDSDVHEGSVGSVPVKFEAVPARIGRQFDGDACHMTVAYAPLLPHFDLRFFFGIFPYSHKVEIKMVIAVPGRHLAEEGKEPYMG